MSSDAKKIAEAIEVILSEGPVITLSMLKAQATKVTDACTDLYLAAVKLKSLMDTAEEIPPDLREIYDRNLKVMGAAGDAKKEAYQSQMEMRKIR